MLPSIISRCLPVARRVELRTSILKLNSFTPVSTHGSISQTRLVSKFAKQNPEVTEEKVDATVLVAKDLAKMFEEIHQVTYKC